MLDPNVLKEIRESDEDVSHSFVVEYRMLPGPDVYHGATTRGDRVARLREFYDTVKSPLIEQLQHEGLEIRDLPASGQVIATGTASQWQSVARKGGPLDDQSVRVLPNVMFYAVNS